MKKNEPKIGDGKYTITDWAKLHVDTCYEPSSDFDRDCMIRCVEVGYNAYSINLESQQVPPALSIDSSADNYVKEQGFTDELDQNLISDAFKAGAYWQAKQHPIDFDLDETMNSLSELIRSLSQIVNTGNSLKLPEYHKVRLDKAKMILGKYADPKESIIVKSVSDGSLVDEKEPVMDGKEKQNIQKAISDIERFSQTHIDWANHFEAYPDIEKKKVKTGNWDTAKEHRQIVADYDNVLDILRSCLVKQPVRKKTLDECKDEAKKILDKHALKIFPETWTGEVATCIYDAMIDYASSKTVEPKQGWIEVKEQNVKLLASIHKCIDMMDGDNVDFSIKPIQLLDEICIELRNGLK